MGGAFVGFERGFASSAVVECVAVEWVQGALT